MGPGSWPGPSGPGPPAPGRAFCAFHVHMLSNSGWSSDQHGTSPEIGQQSGRERLQPGTSPDSSLVLGPGRAPGRPWGAPGAPGGP